MKAILLHEHGGPETLRYEEVPRPEPGPESVLIQVRAVSVNQTLDLGVRQDGAGYEISFPAILGIDVAGIIEEMGTEVSGFRKGDNVTAILRPPAGGSYAEYVVAASERTYHIPDGVSFATAAAVSRHFPMAYSLCRAANLESGQWILVMGAAGALGTASIQVAHHQGAHVIAAAGSDARAQSAMQHGATNWINYRHGNLAEQIRLITNGKGVDVVFENIADPALWPGAFDSLAIGGTLVTVGAHGGGQVVLDVRRLYRDSLTIKSGLYHGQPGDTDESLALAAAGTYHVEIHRVLPLSQAQEAHRIAADRSIIGKVVMDPALDRG